MSDNPALLARILNPGVAWWVAVPCNVLAGAALVLLALDPIAHLLAALALIGTAAIALYGTALLGYVRKKDRGKGT